jgi:predicted nucleic acid-binding protein
MVASRVFIDTNVLVYAHLPLSPYNPAAVSKLHGYAATGAELWISRQVLREFLAAMTRPGHLTGSIPLPSLLADVSRFQTQFLVAEDGPASTSHLLNLISSVPCAGRQVHDANIAATMLAHGIPNVLTHNTADFNRFSAYITVIPLVPPPPPGGP